ncbi:MAG: DUF4340 domain-containing protein [Luteolibacter sp.]|jgi:hypothetical protein
MNPRQVTALWIIAVALAIAVALVKVSQQATRDTATDRSPGDTLFEKFPADKVASITLTSTKGTITLKQKDDGWVLAERDDYPARTTNILSLLRTLGDLKVVQSMEAGPSFAPRFGMDEHSRNAGERGVTAVFTDAAGNEIARVSAGRVLDSGGRFIRNHADESGFYTVNDMLHMFDGEPIRWLDESFLRPEKISSIRVVETTNPGVSLWHVARESEDGDFRLADGAPGEMLESSANESFKRLMSFARFQDVVPAAKIESATADSRAPRIATVETFEGFTYTFTITPAIPAESEEDSGMPPAPDDNLLAVSVAATLPSERKKGDDENEEIAAGLDQAFEERLATLTEKLEKEKALNGRTFRVTNATVEQFLKNRDDITTGPPEIEATDENAAAGSTPGTTTVTTPPIEIPLPGNDAGQ